MLTGLMYVLVPMPYLFFGSASSDYSGYGSLASGCVWPAHSQSSKQQQQQQQTVSFNSCGAAWFTRVPSNNTCMQRSSTLAEAAAAAAWLFDPTTAVVHPCVSTK
jgi:hypothetical protein